MKPAALYLSAAPQQERLPRRPPPVGGGRVASQSPSPRRGAFTRVRRASRRSGPTATWTQRGSTTTAEPRRQPARQGAFGHVVAILNRRQVRFTQCCVSRVFEGGFVRRHREKEAVGARQEAVVRIDTTAGARPGARGDRQGPVQPGSRGLRADSREEGGDFG